jgi:hypothetical protein
LDLREYHVWLNYDVRHGPDCLYTNLYIYILTYTYVHYTLWFIQRCTVTRATPGTERFTSTPGKSQDRSEGSRFLKQWERFSSSFLKK